MTRLDSPSDSPATLSDLTEMQARFVTAYAELGGQKGDATEAAITAGYGGGTNRVAAKARAFELLRNPKVLSALRDELTRKLNGAAALGVNVLIDLAQHGPPQVRLSAAKELLDRGYGPVMSRNAHVVATTSIEDIINRLDMDTSVQAPSRDEFYDAASAWEDEPSDDR